MARTLHIAIFNTDIPVPSVATTRAPTYGHLFTVLLSSAAARTSPTLTVKSTEYDTRKLEYPSSLADIDLILITGSIHSSYSDIPWIHTLERYITAVYRDHPRVKWFGSCFGHQMIAQALLKEYGVRVEADPKGHEIGVKRIAMGSKFRSEFAEQGFEVPETVRMQFIHGDFVNVPDLDGLPEGWSVLGRTEGCGNQGMMEVGRVLTFQGHFEFDRFVNGETVKTFFADRAPEWLDEALGAIDADDDAELAAEMVLHFAMQKMSAGQDPTYKKVGGLVTPPEEVEV